MPTISTPTAGDAPWTTTGNSIIAGLNDLAIGHGARYYLLNGSSGYAVPNVTDTPIFLDASNFTTTDVTRTLGSTATGSTFTINKAGLWMLCGGGRFSSGTSATADRYVCIWVNGGSYRVTAAATQPGAAGVQSLSCSGLASLAVADTVQLVAFHNATALQVEDEFQSTFLSLNWIREA